MKKIILCWLLLISTPSFAIEFIVGTAAGGPADIIARRIAQVSKDKLIVLNKPGANQNIAMKYFVDCKTACIIITGGQAIRNKTLAPEGYPMEMLKEYPFVMIGNMPVAAFVGQKSRYKTFKDLIGKDITVGHAGSGTASYLGLQELCKLSKCTEIGYPGVARAMPDLISGRLDVMFNVVLNVESLHSNPQIVPLAVLSKKSYGGVPSASEQGYKMYANGWYMLLAKNVDNDTKKNIAKVVSSIDFGIIPPEDGEMDEAWNYELKQ